MNVKLDLIEHKQNITAVPSLVDNIMENNGLIINVHKFAVDENDKIVEAFKALDKFTETINPILANMLDVTAGDFTKLSAVGSDVLNGIVDAMDVAAEETNTVIAELFSLSVDKIKQDFKTATEYVDKLNEGGDKAIGGVEFSIFMPIVNLPVDNINHSYSTNTVTAAQALAGKVPLMLAKAFSATQGKQAMLEAGFNRALNIASRMNFTFNSNPVTTYDRTECRKLSFTFLLMPNNAKDAQHILDTIKLLNFFCAGERIKTNKALRMPYIFSLLFTNPELESLIHFNTTPGKPTFWFLNNISVSLGGEGTINMFDDTCPKRFEISLTFLERKPLYGNEINE